MNEDNKLRKLRFWYREKKNRKKLKYFSVSAYLKFKVGFYRKLVHCSFYFKSETDS